MSVVPQLPEAFYGTVELGGEAAPVGTVVEAYGLNVLNPDRYGFNPLVTHEKGKYGGRGGFARKLVVQGRYPEAAKWFYFFVNGKLAQFQAPDGNWLYCYAFEAGEVRELNLRA